ncbi:hypothetical protein ACJEDY_24995, partial [Escherichia coli]
ILRGVRQQQDEPGRFSICSRQAAVVRNGEIKLIRKRLRKKRLTAAQKSALKKARRKAQTGAAKLARKKSMKLRRKRLG